MMAAMKLRKGSKVEVFSKREVPSGSWWCAEIISGNGHIYNVSYDRYSSGVDSVAERVPRKVIRPRPPLVSYPIDWAPGEFVDVFIDSSWILSEVTRLIGGGFFIVRLAGSSNQIQVHSSGMRPRLSWQDNVWSIVSEDIGKCYKGRINNISRNGVPGYQMSAQRMATDHDPGARHFSPSEIYNSDDEASRISLGGTRKRPRNFFPDVDMCKGAATKRIAVEMVGRSRRQVAGHSNKFLEKVDAVASPQQLIGEKHVHTSKRTIARSKMEMGRTNHQNAESISSSVGSCSVNSNPCVTAYPIIGLAQDKNSYQDEASSDCVPERKVSHPMEAILAKEIHCLELLAYRSTMRAFYVSGPMSWEQESLMTNLRISLHISNDEHSVELRHLVSSPRFRS